MYYVRTSCNLQSHDVIYKRNKLNPITRVDAFSPFCFFKAYSPHPGAQEHVTCGAKITASYYLKVK